MWDRSYHEQGNARRELMGLEPEPLPPGLEPTAADIVETLSTTIPHFRRFGSWGYGEGKEFLDAWENTLLEQLSELQRGAKSDG
jgi:hypothetical protein